VPRDREKALPARLRIRGFWFCATLVKDIAQIFVAVLGASSLTFNMASFSQRLPDWIEGQVCALPYFGGVPNGITCDNLKDGTVCKKG
jgi:transposase